MTLTCPQSVKSKWLFCLALVELWMNLGVKSLFYLYHLLSLRNLWNWVCSLLLKGLSETPEDWQPNHASQQLLNSWSSTVKAATIVSSRNFIPFL